MVFCEKSLKKSIIQLHDKKILYYLIVTHFRVVNRYVFLDHFYCNNHTVYWSLHCFKTWRWKDCARVFLFVFCHHQGSYFSNVAPRGIASQVSTRVQGGNASRAIDGNSNPDLDAGFLKWLCKGKPSRCIKSLALHMTLSKIFTFKVQISSLLGPWWIAFGFGCLAPQ